MKARPLPFRRVLQTLKPYLVLLKVDPMLRVKLGCYPVDDPVIPIVTPQRCIAVCGLHLEDSIIKLQDGNVERTAAQVPNQKRMQLAFIQAICQGRRGWLVNDPQDLQPRDCPASFVACL